MLASSEAVKEFSSIAHPSKVNQQSESENLLAKLGRAVCPRLAQFVQLPIDPKFWPRRTLARKFETDRVPESVFVGPAPAQTGPATNQG